MISVHIGSQEIPVTGIGVEDFSAPIPYVLCSQDGRIQGVDMETEAYLTIVQRVYIMFDEPDGRVILVDASLFMDVLYCTPVRLAPSPDSASGCLWQS